MSDWDRPILVQLRRELITYWNPGHILPWRVLMDTRYWNIRDEEAMQCWEWAGQCRFLLRPADPPQTLLQPAAKNDENLLRAAFAALGGE